MHMDNLFNKCVIKRMGGKSIRCKLGLWSVFSPNKEDAEREAKHYWLQHWEDGEYADILGEPEDNWEDDMAIIFNPNSTCNQDIYWK